MMISRIEDSLRRLINKHRLFRIALVIFILALKPHSISSEIYSKLIYDAKSIIGDWQGAILFDRDVKLADRIGQKAKLKIEVPKDGYYKIYLHLYYKWEKTCPKIEFVITNAGKKFTGSITLETDRIAPEMDGRWIFKTLEINKPLYLNKDEAEITLNLKSITSYWEKNIELKTPDGIVAIDYLIIQPIFFENERFVSIDIIEAESFIKNFDILQKTGFISNNSKFPYASRIINIPYPFLFDIYIFLKTDSSDKNIHEQKHNKCKLEIKNKEFELSKNISIDTNNRNWQLVYIDSVYLKKENYKFTIYAQPKSQINIDFLLLSPSL